MSEQLDEFAALLRRAVDDAAAEFGGDALVLTDERQACDPLPSARAFVWAYQVALPMAANAHATLTETVAPRLAAQGWQATVRDTDREFAVHFGRNGFDIGVLIGRADRADIVIGGSTPAIALLPSPAE